MRRALLAVPLLAAAVAGCGGTSTPAAAGSAAPAASQSAPSSTPPPAPSASPSGGHDSIGGSVSATLGKEPTVTVPSTPAPSTLLTKDIVVGHGPVASTADTVTVQYLGLNYADGKPFDSSWSRGAPTTFPLSNVIPGFAQGIAGMAVGGRREIVIPPRLGYGAQGVAPAIGPNETLIFVVDLLKVTG